MTDKPTGAAWTPEPGAIEFIDEAPLPGYTAEEAYAFLMRRGYLDASMTAAVSPDTEQTGAMIALIPSAEDAARLAVPGGEPMDQLHVTMYYLGEAALIGENQRMSLVQAISRIVGGTCTLEAQAFGVGIFNPVEDPCLILNIGGDAVEDIREDLEAALEEAELTPPEQYEPFVAHMTLQYMPDPASVPMMFDRVGAVLFDRVRVAFAGEFVDIPLKGSDMEAETETGVSGYTSPEQFSTDTKGMNMDAKSFRAVGSHDTGTDDGAWDGPANEKKLPSPMSAGTGRKFYAWIDEEAVTDGEMPKTAGRFGHHIVGSDGSPGAANIKACQSGIGVLHGGRGGTTIPSADKQGVYDHLAAHIRDAGLEPPPFSLDFALDTPTMTGEEMPQEEPMPMEDNSAAWEGVLVVEGIETGDGRQFSEGAITWAELPIPLKWQQAQGEGHDGSVIVGRIDRIWRNPEKPSEICGAGIFDADGVNGAEALRLVRGGFLRGVSVDPDSIKDSDVELIFPADSPDAEEDPEDMPIVMPELTIFHAGRLRGATLVDIPAFAEAQIWLTGSQAEELAVTAAASVSAEDVTPPAEFFANPNFKQLTPLTVTEDGRVFGHGAGWNVCHMSFSDACVIAPREGEHSYYRLGEMLCADGSRISVGTITLGTGHAPTYGITAAQAAEHYDNTGTVVAYVASGEDQFGIWFSGVLKAGTPPERVQELRASTLSGDWRRIGGSLRLVAFLAVNHPGFPIPRTATHVSQQRQLSLVAAGVVTPKMRDHAQRRGTAENALKHIARGIGRDPKSRMNALRQKLGR